MFISVRTPNESKYKPGSMVNPVPGSSRDRHGFRSRPCARRCRARRGRGYGRYDAGFVPQTPPPGAHSVPPDRPAIRANRSARRADCCTSATAASRAAQMAANACAISSGRVLPGKPHPRNIGIYRAGVILLLRPQIEQHELVRLNRPRAAARSAGNADRPHFPAPRRPDSSR